MNYPTEHAALIVPALYQAAAAIMEHYTKGVVPMMKGDGSPVTEADMASHRILLSALETSRFPVISEEGDHFEGAESFWLLDPLDGTREFLAGRPEFVISLALILNKRPVEAYIFHPASISLYMAGLGAGAHLERPGLAPTCLPKTSQEPRIPVVLMSRNAPEQDIIKAGTEIPGAKIRSMGSALKYCEIAEGKAQHSFRYRSSARGWDLAAGDLLVNEAGRRMRRFSGQPLEYHPDDRLMPAFRVD